LGGDSNLLNLLITNVNFERMKGWRGGREECIVGLYVKVGAREGTSEIEKERERRVNLL